MNENDLNKKQMSFYADLFYVYEETNGELFVEKGMGEYVPESMLLEVICKHIK